MQTADTPSRDQLRLDGPSSKLKDLFESLGKREKNVAREILRDYPLSALNTVAGLAEQSGVSTSTVLRLVQRLGFAAYGAFQDAVKADVNRLLRSPSARFSAPRDRADGDGSFLKRTFDQVGANLAASVDTVMEADFRQVVEALADPKRSVYCVGGRYARHVAGLLADYLGALRRGVHLAEGQPDGWSRLLVDIGPQAVVIVVDIRRYQRTIQRFATLAAERGAMVVAITDPWATPDSFEAEFVFRLPTASPSLMDSFTGPLTFVEALVGALAVRLGPSLNERLVQCEWLDCVESDLNLAWPGIEKGGG